MERDIHDSTLVETRLHEDQTDKEAEKRCPFAGGLQGLCVDKCAMRTETGCAIITGEKPVFGRFCPFGDAKHAIRCNDGCALYVDGCAMIKRKG